jgi:hypothetical protein
MTGGVSDKDLSPLGRYLRLYHPRYTEADLEPAQSRGNWRVKGGCPGGKDCRHAFRGALGPCAGGGDLIISFSQPGRDEKGRFLRPYRYWESVVKAHSGECNADKADV